MLNFAVEVKQVSRFYRTRFVAKTRTFVGLLLPFFVFTLSFGQVDEVKRITKTLCSPEFHGRGYVNQGDSIAAEFIASEFKKNKLKPLKRKYFQRFQFSVNTFPGKMEVSAGSKKLKPAVHFLVDPASGSSNMIWRPKVLQIETVLNKEKLLSEIQEIQRENKYNSVIYNFTKCSKDTLKMVAGIGDQLAEILPVMEVVNQKFTWSVAKNQLKHAYIQIQDSIYTNQSEWLVNIESKWIETHEAKNVIAYKKGKRKAKTIVFSAHYDHLGHMGSETYFPGGNDNASGTAMLLTMAKYFAETKTDLNLVFMAFAGEEIGLLGSHHYVDHPIFPLSKIDFLINLDIMGSGEEGITIVNATKNEKEFERFVKINDENKLIAQVKKRGPAANSDHYWFGEKGVPAVFIYTQGPNKNYHDIFDTYEALSFNECEDIKTLLIKFVEGY